MAQNYTSSIYVIIDVDEWYKIYGEGTSWSPGYPLSTDTSYSFVEYNSTKTTPAYVSQLSFKTEYSHSKMLEILTGSDWDWGTGSAPGEPEWDGL